MNLGEVSLRRREYQHASGYLRQALALFREAGNQEGEIETLRNLGQPPGEHPRDDRGCGRVGFEAVGAPAPHGTRLVRVRPRITEPVPVRRTAAQVPALLLVWAAIAVRTRILVR